jgi:hypothetical protein
MPAYVRYHDPVGNTQLSEDADNFYLRVAIPRFAVAEHLMVLEATLRGLEALMLCLSDPLVEPEPAAEPEDA